MRCNLLRAAVFVLVATPAASFEIREPETHGLSLSIEEHNKAERKSGFRLSFNKGISDLPSNDLRGFLKSLGLKTPAGNLVKDLFVDRNSGVAIGVSRDNFGLALVQSKKTNAGHELTIAGSDDKGNRVIDPKELGVFSIDGTPRRFSSVPYGSAINQVMRIALLVDTSGSMRGSLPALKKATTTFLSTVAGINDGMLCRITAFNSNFRHSGGFVPCGSLIAEVNKLTAGGGTELQAPLLSAFRALQKFEDPGVVLMITDGQAPVDISTLLKEKSGTLHVLWLGNSFFSRGQYQQLVDTNLFRTGDVKDLARSFYHGLSESVRGQVVLTIPDTAPTN